MTRGSLQGYFFKAKERNLHPKHTPGDLWKIRTGKNNMPRPHPHVPDIRAASVACWIQFAADYKCAVKSKESEVLGCSSLCCTWMCLFYSSLCCHCPCLFYSSLCCQMFVLWQPVLSLDVSVLHEIYKKSKICKICKVNKKSFRTYLSQTSVFKQHMKLGTFNHFQKCLTYF